MQIIHNIKTEVDQRKEICEACPHNVLSGFTVRACELCGCPIGSKTLVPNTRCPADPPKWVEFKVLK